MLHFSPVTKLYVATSPVDFRSGMDSLAGMCRRSFAKDPMDGSVFVFINRQKTSIKLLSYDGQGYWLACKRLSDGRFQHFPKLPPDSLVRVVAEQVYVLLRGGDPLEVSALREWRKIS